MSCTTSSPPAPAPPRERGKAIAGAAGAQRPPHPQLNHPIPDAIFVGESLCWAIYNLMGREAMSRHAPLPATTAAGLVATLAMTPFAAAEWLGRSAPRATPIGVAAVAYTGLLVTVLGFQVLFWALGRASAARVAVMMYVQPLVGVLLSWWLLGEPLGGWFLLGAALMLAGVGLVVFQNVERKA